jgi:hypothetical protein
MLHRAALKFYPNSAYPNGRDEGGPQTYLIIVYIAGALPSDLVYAQPS